MTTAHPTSGPRVLDREALVAWGEALGRSLHAPALVAVTGELGAGKTTLIQAICRGYGVTTPVTSPTFALVHEYSSLRGPVYHLDLYRLKNPAELTNIGWDEVVASDALVLVEWPERAGGRMPAARTTVRLAHVPAAGDRRTLEADTC